MRKKRARRSSRERIALAIAAVVAAAGVGWVVWRSGVGHAPRAPAADAAPAKYTLTRAPGGGHRIVVPFLGVEAWLPGEPTHYEMHEQTPFGSVLVEEVADTVRELDFTGCSVSWYPAGDDPGSRFDEIVRGHARRLVGELVESKEIRVGDRPARESLIRMTHAPNEGSARVRHVIVGSWVVALHTFRYRSMDPNPTVTRCLESLVVAPAKE